jgi:hypothetical protein
MQANLAECRYYHSRLPVHPFLRPSILYQCQHQVSFLLPERFGHEVERKTGHCSGTRPHGQRGFAVSESVGFGRFAYVRLVGHRLKLEMLRII